MFLEIVLDGVTLLSSLLQPTKDDIMKYVNFVEKGHSKKEVSHALDVLVKNHFVTVTGKDRAYYPTSRPSSDTSFKDLCAREEANFVQVNLPGASKKELREENTRLRTEIKEMKVFIENLQKEHEREAENAARLYKVQYDELKRLFDEMNLGKKD